MTYSVLGTACTIKMMTKFEGKDSIAGSNDKLFLMEIELGSWVTGIIFFRPKDSRARDKSRSFAPFRPPT